MAAMKRRHARPRRASIPIGSIFGRLTVKQEVKRGRHSWFICQCSCGNETTIQMNNLRPGGTKSCGCAVGTHGMAKRGQNRTPTYSSWSHMITRCTNPNFHAFPRYGGRGISVHPEWMVFDRFLTDMGECPAGLTLERIDNDGDYKPGNCRWGTRPEQARNRSMTRWVLLDGETLCFTDAAARLGVSEKTMQSRRRENGISHQATVDHYAERRRTP